MSIRQRSRTTVVAFILVGSLAHSAFGTGAPKPDTPRRYSLPVEVTPMSLPAAPLSLGACLLSTPQSCVGLGFEPHVGFSYADEMVAAVGYAGFDGNHFNCVHHFTLSSGREWLGGNLMTGAASMYDNCGDSVITFGKSAGFYAGLAFDDDVPGQEFNTCVTDSAIVVSRFSGISSLEDAVVVASESSPDVFVDKPWAAADRNNDHLFVTWTQFEENPAGALYCARSTLKVAAAVDSALSPLTFTAPIDLGVVGDTDSVNDGPTATAVAVDGRGRGNIAWFNNPGGSTPPGKIQFRQCYLEAQSVQCTAGIQNVANIEPFYVVGSSDSNHYIRADSFPSVAVDSAPGGNENIYVVWSEYINNSRTDVFFSVASNVVDATSSSQFLFSPKVNLTSGAVQRHRFFPAISVDDRHRVHVIYYEITPSTDTYKIKYRMSADGGITWSAAVEYPANHLTSGSPLPVGGTASEPGFLTDYVGLSGKDGVLGVFNASSSETEVIPEVTGRIIDCGTRDRDNDGTMDLCDECMDPDGDGIGDPGWPDQSCAGPDNCPTIANATQANQDADAKGDACDRCLTIADGCAAGNCDCGNVVDVSNLLTMISIMLGEASVEQCLPADPNFSGTVTVDELLLAVNNILNGCVAIPKTYPSAAPNLAIGSVTGYAGGAAVLVPVRIQSSQGTMSAVQLDLIYDPVKFANPDCYIGPTAGSTHVLSWSHPTSPPPPAGKARVRVVVRDEEAPTISNLADDSVVASCAFFIQSGTANGTYPVTGETVHACDSSGASAATTVTNGSIVVTSPPGPGPGCS